MATHRKVGGPTFWARWSNTIIGALVLIGGMVAHGMQPGWSIAWVVYVLARFQVNEANKDIVMAYLPDYDEPMAVQVVRPATTCQKWAPWAAPAAVLLVDWSDLLVSILG